MPSSGARSSAPTKFAFIVHPTDYADVERYEPGARGKNESLIAKILSWMPPYLAARLTGIETPDGRRAEGLFAAVPLLPQQMLALPREVVYEKILQAIRIAADAGAQIAGLGAFTGIVGDGGLTIAERSPIPVTTGNSLTIAAAVHSLLAAARMLGRDPRESTLTITGATGSIGAACVELLADKVRRIILTAPNATRLRTLTDHLQPRAQAELLWTIDARDAIRRSELILTASSAFTTLIEADDLQPGAAVCEISKPHNIGAAVAELRPDVLFFEGGFFRMPGAPRWERVREPGTVFDMGLPENSALACMSETMVLALEKRFTNYTLGRGIAIDRVREIDAMAAACGFTHADLRGFAYRIRPEQIENARRAVYECAAR